MRRLDPGAAGLAAVSGNLVLYIDAFWEGAGVTPAIQLQALTRTSTSRSP